MIAVVVIGILALIFMVMVLRLHAFVALLLVSMGVGLAAGMSFQEVLSSTQTGMGNILGYIAVVVGLGAMFGQMLESTGGAQRLAHTLVAKFGAARASWALTLAGFLIAIPVFFEVGFVILIPLVYSLSKANKRSVLCYAIPLVAGLAVAHAFIPPTPGPMAAAGILGADLGRVILYGVAAGLPAAILAGPVWGNFIGARIKAPVPSHVELPEEKPEEDLPSFGLVFGLLLIPILLIVANTVSNSLVPADPGNLAYEASNARVAARFFAFAGHPFVALMVATLLSFYFLGIRRGYTLSQVQALANRSLGPAGMIILVTGAGGVFKQILTDSKIGETLARSLMDFGMTPVALAFCVAAAVRVSQGSATVAMMTAAGLVGGVLELARSAPAGDPLAAFAQADLALITIAIAAGSTVLSHVNDSGFWLVKEFLGLTEAQTLKSWTVMTTIVGVVGLFAASMVSLVFG
jgi:Gnt-I system low-affinity gluconate transporter